MLFFNERKLPIIILGDHFIVMLFSMKGSFQYHYFGRAPGVAHTIAGKYSTRLFMFSHFFLLNRHQILFGGHRGLPAFVKLNGLLSV